MSTFHDRTKSNEEPQYWKILKERTHYQLWNTLPQVCSCQSSVILAELLLKLGAIQWFCIGCLISSFKIRIFIYFSFPLLFLVSFTNKVCLYRFQGRFNIRQPFFLGFLFLYQKLELSLLQVVHTLIYNLLPNPGKKGDFCTDLFQFV